MGLIYVITTILSTSFCPDPAWPVERPIPGNTDISKAGPSEKADSRIDFGNHSGGTGLRFPRRAPFSVFNCALSLAFTPILADITGTITRDQGKPVAGAFVRFVDALDSSREATAFTNDAGKYSLKLPEPGVGLFRPLPMSGRNPAAFPLPTGYSLTGRALRSVPDRRAASPIYLRPRPAGSRAEADPAAATAAAKSGAAAARSFHVTVCGKGIMPLQLRGSAVEDNAVRDFTLPATPLWDSGRAVLRNNLADCANRFRSAKQGRVAFLGGSITFNPGWRDSVQNYLKKKFPQTAFDFINAGIPSVGCNMHGFRFRRDALARGQVDLLFVESAVNDTTNKVPSIERTRAYEGIVRQALKSNPAMDIVFLYFIDPSFYPEVKAGKPISLLADYEKSAWQYGVSSVNLAQYVAERYTWEQFGGDVHPGAFGQGIYAAGIARLFDAAWNAPGAADAPTLPHHLPVRMQDSLCYHQGHTDSVSRGVIVNGWKRVASWKPSQGGTRDGFVNVPVLESVTPGDTLKFAFTGTAVGIVIAAGYDVGMLDYTIDGKPMGTVDQFTPWSSGLHIPWTLLFSGDLPMKAHELRLINAAGKNPASQGHGCRIIRFIVNGPDA
jgi:hypothetical protein